MYVQNVLKCIIESGFMDSVFVVVFKVDKYVLRMANLHSFHGLMSCTFVMLDVAIY